MEAITVAMPINTPNSTPLNRIFAADSLLVGFVLPRIDGGHKSRFRATVAKFFRVLLMNLRFLTAVGLSSNQLHFLTLRNDSWFPTPAACCTRTGVAAWRLRVPASRRDNL